jgi:hypothetical protein
MLYRIFMYVRSILLFSENVFTAFMVRIYLAQFYLIIKCFEAILPAYFLYFLSLLFYSFSFCDIFPLPNMFEPISCLHVLSASVFLFLICIIVKLITT